MFLIFCIQTPSLTKFENPQEKSADNFFIYILIYMRIVFKTYLKRKRLKDQNDLQYVTPLRWSMLRSMLLGMSRSTSRRMLRGLLRSMLHNSNNSDCALGVPLALDPEGRL